MFPVLLKVGNLVIRTYGVIVAIAVITGILVSDKYIVEKHIVDEDTFLNIAIWAIVGGAIGARILWVLTSPYLSEFLRHPLEILEIWRGGLSFLGMALGGFVAVLLSLRHYKVDIYRFVDVGVLGLSIGYGVGKFACFFNGCCHGVKVASWWPKVFPLSLYFTNPQSECEILNAYLYPTQLLNALSGWITFFALLYILKKGKAKYPGQLVLYFGLIFAPMEFLVDLIRYIPTRFHGLTPNQWGSIGILLIAILWNYRAKQNLKMEA